MANEPRAGSQEKRLRDEVKTLLLRRREAMEMSQGEFASALSEHLGHRVSQSQISDWERGRFEPGATVLLALADMANQSIDELRGAGPPAMVDRVARLERRVERIGDVADPDPPVGEELRRIGVVLVQIIEVLDDAGLWPSDSAKAARERVSGLGEARGE